MKHKKYTARIMAIGTGGIDQWYSMWLVCGSPWVQIGRKEARRKGTEEERDEEKKEYNYCQKITSTKSKY
jgi:hypothetical protein